MEQQQKPLFQPVIVAVSWLLMTAALTAMVFVSESHGTLHGDDAMRMVEVLDLLDGQSWTDTTQYRDNTPFGASMHWSRLVDAPLALLVLVLRPLFGVEAATAAAFVWPLLLLLAAIALLVAITGRLVGSAGIVPVAVLTATALPLYSEFYPGRIDHHNVQVVLTLALILATVNARTSRLWAALAGLVAATALAVGTESFPVLLVGLVIVPLFWAVDPDARRPLLAFALSFAAATLAHYLAVTAPADYLAAACDALSLTYVTAAGLYLLAIAAVLALGDRLRHPALRLGALGVAGIAALAVLLWLFPECRGGPYGGVDADLAPVLMTEIGEAQSLWVWAGGGLRPGLTIVLLPFIGLGAVIAASVFAPPARRMAWLTLLAFAVALVLVMIVQVRGFRVATMAVLPGCAWLVAVAWAWFRRRQTVAAAVVAGLVVAGMMGSVHWALGLLVQQQVAPQRPALVAASRACRDRDNFTELAQLPPGRIVTSLIFGAQVLLYTDHSILTAGYHRNEDGLRDTIRFFSGDEAAARQVALERGLDYLVFCRGIPPEHGLHGLPPFSGTDWAWLRRRSPPEAALQIYEVAL